MASSITAKYSFSFPSDHLEQVSRAISTLTVDPYKSILYYFFPFIGAFFANYQKLQSDASLEAMMPKRATEYILREIQDLTHCAGITRQVIPYVALNHQFSSCGGLYSFTRPALFLPDQHLFRRNGNSPFGGEKQDENLRDKEWVFSDDETRFFIARELGQIKENSALLRIAIKVSLLTALFAIYMSPHLGFALFVGALGLYILSERLFQARADTLGVELLGRKIQNPFKVAIAALEKIRRQNLYRRENSKIARLYITQSGNHVLDFIHPYLTTRIERLKACEKNG